MCVCDRERNPQGLSPLKSKLHVCVDHMFFVVYNVALREFWSRLLLEIQVSAHGTSHVLADPTGTEL